VERRSGGADLVLQCGKSSSGATAQSPTIGSARRLQFHGCSAFLHAAIWIGETLMNRIFLRFAYSALVAIAALLAPAQLNAQEPGNLPETKAPAPVENAPAAPVVDNPSTQHNKQLKEDWPWLGKFREADLNLAPPAAGENRVVFMGDSITEGWKFDGPVGSFPGKPYINRGISGQTTPQMVLRFPRDVIALNPKVVVILAGINDIAGNTGPETLEQIEDNLASMADLATAHHIRVVLCSVLPAFDFPWSPGKAPAPKVLALNAWIKAYAAQNGHVYVDFHTAMKDDRDGLPATLSKDGVHPTNAGYAVMTPLVEAGIEKALRQ
jgi:lysophospholipase L1-like esterase